jgi:hypothetical protein
VRHAPFSACVERPTLKTLPALRRSPEAAPHRLIHVVLHLGNVNPYSTSSPARGGDLRRLLLNERLHPTALQHFLRRHSDAVTPALDLMRRHAVHRLGFFTATSNSVLGPMTSAHSDCLKMDSAVAAAS